MDERTQEPTIAHLTAPHVQSRDEDRSLAARYMPAFRLDRHDPFAPTIVGYTVHRYQRPNAGAASNIRLVIDYAIWWDWCISALGTLRNVRVGLDENGRVVSLELPSSAERERLEGQLWTDGTGLVLHCEPTRHELGRQAGPCTADRGRVHAACGRHAGRGGVSVIPVEGTAPLKTPQADRLAHSHLSRHAFEPSFEFDKISTMGPECLVPWPALAEWIPRRMAWWIGELERRIPAEQRRFWRIAHRGASAHAPENTLAAIVRAAELGADMVELDVHSSEDGTAVIIHDAEVSRTTNGRGFVYSMHLNELRKLDAGGGEQIPTLEEAMACCSDHDLGVYLELKNDFVVPAIVDLVRRDDLYDRVIVAAFRPDWLAEVRSHDARIQTSVLFGSTHVDPVALARAVGARYVHPCWEYRAAEPHRLLTPEWIRRVRAAHLGIVSWHEERPGEIAALRRLGLDGICSNAPEMLLPQVFERAE